IEKLIDTNLMSQLAGKQAVTVTDQQVTERMTKEASTPESRHLWVIGIKPKLTGTETTPTDQEKADAKAKADQALADLKAGKPWADVAKELPDEVYSSQGGDAGWVTSGTSIIDEKVESALF